MKSNVKDVKLENGISVKVSNVDTSLLQWRCWNQMTSQTSFICPMQYLWYYGDNDKVITTLVPSYVYRKKYHSFVAIGIATHAAHS